MMGCQLQRHRHVRLGCERDPEPSCFLKAPSIGRGSAGQQRGVQKAPILPIPVAPHRDSGTLHAHNSAQPAPHPTQTPAVPRTCGRALGHMSRVWGPAVLAYSCSWHQTKPVSCHNQQDVYGSTSVPGSTHSALLFIGHGEHRTTAQPPAPKQDAPASGAFSLQQPRAQAAHQFSLLMWSPKPGVSMTVSFMRTPFSSISEMERKADRVSQACSASRYSFQQAQTSPPRGCSTAFVLYAVPPAATLLVPFYHN